MMGRTSAGYLRLLQRFVSGIVPHYNALASPIDALRTGAILEERFYQTLPFEWFPQYRVQSDEMDVFRASLDFAKLDEGRVVDFIELKTVNLDEYIENIQPIVDDNDALLEFLKRKRPSYYNQIQEQMYCAGLDVAHLVFLSVTSYDDAENYARDIKDNEYVMVTVPRDNDTISEIKEKGKLFQIIRDELKNN
jgi:hypothetical protein